MSVATIIKEIQEHATMLAEKVIPGQPAILNEAASVGDGIWQGDLGIEIVEMVPPDYVLVENPTDNDRQLVPGNTQGSKHILKSINSVKLYRPDNWPNIDGLLGPCLVVTEDTVIVHPTHGSVTITAGHTVLCRYQREWDQEQKQAKRNAD